MNSQIAENLNKDQVFLYGISHNLEKLCHGVLISGATGSGKSTTFLNPLCHSLANHCVEEKHQKAALVYLNVKGSGAQNFIQGVSENRRQDVVELSNDGGVPIDFFTPDSYSNHEECASAVAAFLEEFLTQVTESFGSTRESQFWVTQRSQIFSALSRIEILEYSEDDSESFRSMNTCDLLASTVHRIRHFLDYVSQAKTITPPPKEFPFQSDRDRVAQEFQKLVEENLAFSFNSLEVQKSLPMVEKNHTYYQRPNLQVYSLGCAVLKRMQELDKAPQTSTDRAQNELQKHHFNVFLVRVNDQQRAALKSLVNSYVTLASDTWSCVQAELRGLLEHFFTGPLGRMMSAPSESKISFESVIDRGKILVVDLQGEGTSRSAMIAIKLALQSKILIRNRLRCNGSEINRLRPIVIAMDEAHSLVTKGRRNESLFLSQCREFGCITILAVQNLQLLQAAIGNVAQFEALLGNLKTRFFAHNSDTLTNSMGSFYCGNKVTSHERQIAATWVGSPQFLMKALTVPEEMSSEPLVYPSDFLRLSTGQAYLVSAEGDVWKIDARNHLPSPAADKISEKKEVLK